jgi:hypothetical protein
MNNTKLAHAMAAIVVFVTIGAPFLCAGIRAVPGEQRRWALDFRVRLEQPGGERPIEVDLNGDWVSTVSAVRPGEYDVALELANASIRGGIGKSGDGLKSAPADTSEQLRQRLARRFWATYRDDGALLAFHFFKDMSPSDRNLLQTIATETQLVHGDPDRPAWTALERDGGGEYLAIYNRTDPNTVTKRKLKYVYTDGPAGATAGEVHVDVDQSELRVSLDPEGGIMALDGSNRVRIGVPLEGAGQLVAVTETHLANLRRSEAPELAGSLARVLADVVSSPIVTHAPDREHLRAEHDALLLEGRTIESLLAAALVDQAKTKGADRLLPDRLAALFRQRPEAPAAAVALVRKNGPAKRITDALGSAGSPAAIDALGSIARDRTLPRPLRIDALTAFMLAQHPPVEGMRAPAALLDDDDARIASAARIVSGALARAGRVAHPAEADLIDAALVSRYRKAQGTGEAPDLLAALGNSLGPSVTPVIEDALSDPRIPVRAAAARALRLAPGPGVDHLLSAAITGDHDPSVRAAAIFAVSFRHPIGQAIGEALLRAANSDPFEYVRSAAITLLRQNPNASPGIAQTLAWIAEHDSKPGVRRLAQEALTSKE